MPWNNRSHLANMHATLSASQNAWTNYTLDKLESSYLANRQKAHGNELHEFAATSIRLRQRLADLPLTLNMYVNDAVGYRMTPEQVLYVSPDAFGTADAIDDRDDFLRIFDLKTGLTETTFRQHQVYAAYYCIEYKKDPRKLKGMDFRIYQNDEIKYEEGDPHTIIQLMDTVKMFVPRLAQLRSEVE